MSPLMRFIVLFMAIAIMAVANGSAESVLLLGAAVGFILGIDHARFQAKQEKQRAELEQILRLSR